ncbi:outer envelope membrane protein 7-like [Phragmites australis]|uniref:outer envelope membrane protein 7-like n=1 Tax=Phragmites australis TaxID=29695 RepID=UPI002D786404|nr:outer envelope membrane protein 7-like [Phragmites australis]
MAKGGGGQREGNALKTAVIVAGGLALVWVTVETAFRPFLDRLRAAVSRSTDPARDPDQEAPAPAAAAEEEEKAPAPAEPSAPPVPAGLEEKVEEKAAELEEAAAASNKAE